MVAQDRLQKQEFYDFFNPRSIAVIGASQDFGTIGGKTLMNLVRHGFGGNVYPINPKYDEIAGYRCYSSLRELPEVPDIALVAVPKKLIMGILAECAELGLKRVVIFSSGFAETDDDGRHLQGEMVKFARENGIRIVGPNSIGCLNVKSGIPMGFATSLETEKPLLAGPVGLVSQSGAFGFSVFGLAQEQQIGFSYVLNTGNQADIHAIDLMRAMLEDEDTALVAGYIEGIPDGAMFVETARRAKQLRKPLIVLKAGQSELGRKSALSHTASVTGSSDAFNAVAKQFGIVQVRDMDDMIDAMKVFARGKFPGGGRIAVLSNSGAAGITIADYCESLGIELAALSDNTTREIGRLIPSFGSASNPIDITAQALMEKHLIRDVMAVLAEADEVDVILLQTTFSSRLSKDIFDDIKELDRKTDKPIIVVHTGTEEIVGEARSDLQSSGIPVFDTCYRAIVAVRHLVEFARFCGEADGEPPAAAEVPEIQNFGAGLWTEEAVKPLLGALGIRVPQGVVIESREQLAHVRGQIRYPAVVKLMSPDVPHKTEAGAVRIGIADERALEEALDGISASVRAYKPDARVQGFLIEDMIRENGVEMFIGIIDDAQFGPLVACGLGGIFLEVFRDRSLRLAPFGLEEAHGMLRELKGYPLLTGARGKKRLDVDAVARALVRVSQLADRYRGRLAEMDVNPVLVMEEGKGIAALDGLMVWK